MAEKPKSFNEKSIMPKDESLEVVLDNQGDNKEEIDTEKELSYQKLINLKKSIKCMTVCNEKVEMCQQVAKQFTALAGYKDAEECAKACRKIAKQTKEEIRNNIYEEAKNKKNTAKSGMDYKRIAEEFRKISGYKDADDLAAECDQLSLRIENKAGWKRWVKYVIAVACIITVIAASNTSHAKYYLANAFMVTGTYNSAIKMYTKLGAYKDCEERLIKCQYKNGSELDSKGDYNSAVKAFEAAGTYKDSEKRKVETEKKAIMNSKVGDKIEIGGSKWKVMDLKSDKALLMKQASVLKTAYNETSGSVTWETSTLRKWLNSDFLNASFTETERGNIILSDIVNSDNAVYGTDGGNDTQDNIFILSVEEVQKYDALVSTFQSNCWLRSPGFDQTSTAFHLGNNTVMPYGYIATSTDIAVYPAMWFNIK